MSDHPAIAAQREELTKAFRADPERLIAWAADVVSYLNSKSEWDMDDNFETTEGLVALGSEYGACDISDETESDEDDDDETIGAIL